MESFRHKDIKNDFFWCLSQNDQYIELEKVIGSKRTDAFTEINGHALAIEIQCTPTNISTIVSRMQQYTAAGVYTLWLIAENILQDKDLTRNLKWVSFLQTIQNGVIFLPTNGSKIIPARIDNSLKFHNGGMVSGNKVLDQQEPIELNELSFIQNNGLNITTIDAWWLESYMDLF